MKKIKKGWPAPDEVEKLKDRGSFESVYEPTKEDYQKIGVDWVLENPSRYVGKSGMQVFDIINEFGLDFYEGNALKYLIRYKKKNGLEDLKKCRDYLDYMIAGYME